MNRNRLRVIYEKTNGRCWYCSSGLHPLGDWQVEHQNPRSQGGSDKYENLVPACRACNARKGNRTVEQYRHALLVKLENAITAAFELSEETEAYVGWQKSESDELYPPEDLSKVISLLSHAADTAVNLFLAFHGERGAVTDPSQSISEEAEMCV